MKQIKVGDWVRWGDHIGEVEEFASPMGSSGFPIVGVFMHDGAFVAFDQISEVRSPAQEEGT